MDTQGERLTFLIFIISFRYFFVYMQRWWFETVLFVWLQVQAYYSFQPLTAYLAVNYMDRFLYARRLPVMVKNVNVHIDMTNNNQNKVNSFHFCHGGYICFRVFVLPTHNFSPICILYPISLQFFSPQYYHFPSIQWYPTLFRVLS